MEDYIFFGFYFDKMCYTGGRYQTHWLLQWNGIQDDCWSFKVGSCWGKRMDVYWRLKQKCILSSLLIKNITSNKQDGFKRHKKVNKGHSSASWSRFQNLKITFSWLKWYIRYHIAQCVIGYSVVIGHLVDNDFWQLSKLLQMITVNK